MKSKQAVQFVFLITLMAITASISAHNKVVVVPFGSDENDSNRCPDGVLGTLGSCYFPVDRIGGSCPLGSVEDAEGLCRKPVANTAVGGCPIGSLGAPGACYILVDIIGVCPLGSIEVAGGLCRVPVTVCPIGSLGAPDACYTLVDMIGVCPLGSVEVAGLCRVAVANAVLGLCPIGSLGTPGGCYGLVYKIWVCPLGSVEDAVGLCRKPVANASAP